MIKFYLPGLYFDSAATAMNRPRIFINDVTAAISALSETSDHPATAMSNPSTAEYWQSTLSDNSEAILFTATQPINYIAIQGHNLWDATDSDVVIKYRANTGDAWTTHSTHQVIDSGDGDKSPVIIAINETTGPYFRVELIANDATINPRAAVLYAGKMITFPRNLYVGHTPITYANQTRVVSGMSNNGQFLGRVIQRESKRTSVTLKSIPPDFFRTEVKPFIDRAKTHPFFWSWRGGDYPKEVSYSWLTGDVSVSNQSPNGDMEISFEMEAYSDG